jgi:uncharacterized protein YndB with AHSA1/START domain
MADIIREFTVKARPERVFQLFATPSWLEKWWTQTENGESRGGGTMRLYFGPQFDWQAIVTRNQPPFSFELQIMQAHPDWMGTLVGCDLAPEGDEATRVRFYHTGWPEQNEHWRISWFLLGNVPPNPAT